MERRWNTTDGRRVFGYSIVATASAKLYSQCHDVLVHHGGTVCAANIAMLKSLLTDSPPVLLIVDINLPALEGVGGIASLLQNSSTLPTLVVTEVNHEETALSLLRNGVSGYCTREKVTSELARACQVILDGEIWAERRVVSRLLKDMRSGTGGSTESGSEILSQLTPREQEITELVADGLCQKNIAKVLDISENTVRNHLGRIFNKVGVSSRLQLALLMKRE